MRSMDKGEIQTRIPSYKWFEAESGEKTEVFLLSQEGRKKEIQEGKMPVRMWKKVIRNDIIICFLSQCSVAVKRYHDHKNYFKGKYLFGSIFRGLLHYQQSSKYHGTKANVLEKQLWFLNPDSQVVERERRVARSSLDFWNFKAHNPVTYFFQRGHPYSNKTIPLNSFK